MQALYLCSEPHPLIGPTRGGTKVTVDGSNFNMQASTFCRFGDLPVAVNFVFSNTETRIECISPTMPAGFSPLLLTSNDQNYFDDGLTFEHVNGQLSQHSLGHGECIEQYHTIIGQVRVTLSCSISVLQLTRGSCAPCWLSRSHASAELGVESGAGCRIGWR